MCVADRLHASIRNVPLDEWAACEGFQEFVCNLPLAYVLHTLDVSLLGAFVITIHYKL